MAGKSIDWRPGPTVCRCCLTEGCYKDISTEYFWMGKREVYSEMLLDSFDLSISYSQSGAPNSNSRLICEPCISRLRDAADFKRQVIECEKTFKQLLDPTSSTSHIDITFESEKDVKLEKVKLEKNLSDDEDFLDDAPGFGDDDDDDLDDQPLTKLATKIPKKEAADLLDLLDSKGITVKRKATAKAKVPAKKSKTVAKPSASKIKLQTEPKKKKGIEIAVVDQKWNLKRKYNDHRNNAAIIIECSNVCPFKWSRGMFLCLFCPATFGDLRGLSDHNLEHTDFKVSLYYRNDKGGIKVGIRKLRCKLCEIEMANLDLLSDHLISVHSRRINKEHGLGMTPFFYDDSHYLCSHCDERFVMFSSLNSHINKHYPNNICFVCGKAFSSANRLKSHMTVHQGTNTRCKCSHCKQEFSSRGERTRHIEETHGPEYKYRCPYCSESFRKYIDRSKHLNKHHGKKIEYACHLCDSVFALCNQRTRHIRQVHIRNKEHACDLCSYETVTAAQLRRHMIKHNGERIHQCQVCKKAYARIKTLKEHMRIHNNDKRFVCNYCNNAFVQKCSLKSHLRTHHPQAEELKDKKQ